MHYLWVVPLFLIMAVGVAVLYLVVVVARGLPKASDRSVEGALAEEREEEEKQAKAHPGTTS